MFFHVNNSESQRGLLKRQKKKKNLKNFVSFRVFLIDQKNLPLDFFPSVFLKIGAIPALYSTSEVVIDFIKTVSFCNTNRVYRNGRFRPF